MKNIRSLLALSILLFAFSCQQPGKNTFTSKVKLPPDEQGLMDQFRRAATQVPDSLDDDRKKFLEDSLKTVIEDWLSNKTGLKADRWLGVVMNDTVGQSFGAEHGNALQLFFPINKTSDTATAALDLIRSITVTMSIDEDDLDMMKARKQLYDGDTVVFSGYFESISDRTSDMFSHPGDFLESPSLDLTPTELYKKGTSTPTAKPNPDTAGLAKAPVQASAKITSSGSGKERSITIDVKVKNISDKPVSKVRVQWMVINKDEQPAKVNGATGAWQEGYFNDELAPGETVSSSWLHMSPDGQKIQLIYPKWATLYNGIKWRVGKR